MDRRKLIGLIHVAKNNARCCPVCGKVIYRKKCADCNAFTEKLDEERYRKILGSFGASSCRFMAEPELEKVYRFFLQAGFKPRGDPEAEYAAARKRTIAITIAEAKRLFGEDLWEPRLMGFVRKTMGKERLQECDDKELRKAIGWIRRYRKYLEKRGEEKGNEERN